MERDMLAINVVAFLGLILMLGMYVLTARYMRQPAVQQTGMGKKKAARRAAAVSTQEKNIGLTIFAAVMIVAFLMRIIIAGIHKGHETDMNCFLLWGDMVYNDGIHNFYTSPSFTDYPPGYMYILYIVGFLRSVIGTSKLLVKAPAMCFDLLLGIMTFFAAKKKFSKKLKKRKKSA